MVGWREGEIGTLEATMIVSKSALTIKERELRNISPGSPLRPHGQSSLFGTKSSQGFTSVESGGPGASKGIGILRKLKSMTSTSFNSEKEMSFLDEDLNIGDKFSTIRINIKDVRTKN